MNPRIDDAVPYAAPPGLTASRPERDDLGAGVQRDGGGRAVMVICSAVLVAAAVVLALADRLA
ncbi:hypothetical protein [Streptomyces sp. NWU339]|uniref:hypothetical protein n=1 Tax=Streptomyces sp. NWU339 TaxID=2185284 RepID=UPI0011B4B6AF|nr:hypothetical protein [Streptomyces sp. NWU339]